MRRSHLKIIGAVILGGAIAAGIITPITVPGGGGPAPIVDLYVSVSGNDSNAGTSAGAPLRTLQAALNKVQPGTTVHLAPGTYTGNSSTSVDGTTAKPITISGGETGQNPATRANTILNVSTASHVLDINNSHYILTGFTVDGNPALAGQTFPTTLTSSQPTNVHTFKDGVQGSAVNSKDIYIGSTANGVNDVTLTNLYIRRSGGECVRIKGNATNIDVTYSYIEWCGMVASGDDVTGYKYHNAEGVYIGVAATQGSDTTNNVTVDHNIINTFGSECVDVKEQSTNNIITNNTCAYNDEPTTLPNSTVVSGSSMEFRGQNNTVTGNTIQWSNGDGIKVKADAGSPSPTGDTIISNTLSNIQGVPLTSQVSFANSSLCGNTYTGSATGALVTQMTTACVTTANLWVNNTGSGGSCTRTGGPGAGFSAGSSCNTLQAAYNSASCGDLVLVQDGTVTGMVQRLTGTSASQKSCTAGTCDQFQVDASTPPTGTTTGCITFRPEHAGAVTINNSSNLYFNATFVRLDGFIITPGQGFGLVAKSATSGAGTADSCNAAFGHDDIVINMTQDSNATPVVPMAIQGGHNISVINSSFGNSLITGASGISDKLANCDGGTTHVDSDHVMLNGVTIHDMLANTGTSGHAECLFFEPYPRFYTTIINSKFQNCYEQNISMQNDTANTQSPGCASGPGCNMDMDHVTIENNWFDATCSHCAALGKAVGLINNISLICNKSGANVTNFVFRNNTLGNQIGSAHNGLGNFAIQEDHAVNSTTGAPLGNDCSVNGGGNWQITATGNIWTGITCSTTYTHYQPVENHNLVMNASGTGCAGGDTPFGSNVGPYVDETNYNFDLTSGAGPALGLVPLSTGYPATDIHGVARPNPADAGAAER